LFAGIYYWFPKITGRKLNDRLGKLHFWGSLIGMNGIFLPMFIQGLAGMNRRLYDGGRAYEAFSGFDGSFRGQAWSAVFLGVGPVVLHRESFLEPQKGARVSDNPWDATTWSGRRRRRPPAHNFEPALAVHRGPYDYSVPGAPRDFTPQNQP
jgi:cytochrome c oxidase subunit 1